MQKLFHEDLILKSFLVVIEILGFPKMPDAFGNNEKYFKLSGSKPFK